VPVGAFERIVRVTRAKEARGMIANDYQLALAKAELAKCRSSLADLDAILATLPLSIAAQVKAQRPSTIRRRIQELEAEIQQYAATQRSAVMIVSHL
jgi:uncharacterized membrane protein